MGQTLIKISTGKLFLVSVIKCHALYDLCSEIETNGTFPDLSSHLTKV